MFKFGFRLHDFTKQSFLAQVELLKEKDIRYIQLAFDKAIDDMDFSLGKFNMGLAHYVGDTLKENNIHVAVLGSYINPVEEDEHKRRIEIEKFKERILYAKYIGADLVGTETGTLNPWEKSYDILLDTMKELTDYAEKLGVMIAVEGVACHTLKSPRIIKRFLDDINSPCMSIIFDPVNLIDSNNYLQQHNIVDEAFELYGQKIAAIHLKDFKIINGEKHEVGVGEGEFDFTYFFKALKEKKPYIVNLLEGSNRDRVDSDREFLTNLYNSL